MDRILRAEGDTPDRYKLSKQADVAMLFYLLSDEEILGVMFLVLCKHLLWCFYIINLTCYATFFIK